MERTRTREVVSVGVLVFFLGLCAATSKPKESSDNPPAVTNAPTDETLPTVFDQDIVQRLTKKLTVAAGCPSTTAPNRLWCAVDGFAKGTRAPLPQGAMIGLTIGLSEDFPAEQSLMKNVELSALGVDARPSGTMAWLTSIKPKSPQEEKNVAEGVFNAAAFFKAPTQDVKIESGLYGYVSGLPASAKYPVRQAANAWRIAGPAATDLRKVGDIWVAIEVPPAKPLRGIYVTLLTPRVKSR